jgi:ribosome-associated toxin RatA of RatAB toxin-antitoxin module
MVDSGSDSILVNASPEKCFAVATSFADYPAWAKDVKQADIKDRDAQGRALIVDYRASALGRSTHFTLKYDYSNSPRRLSWSMVDGDIMREIHGAYTFEAQGDQTKISYDLSIELIIPLPGFVKRRAEVRILSTLKELKARIES